jgi:acyl dehydratase
MRRTSAGTYVVMRYGTRDTASGALLTDSLSGTMFRGVPMTADAPESLGEVPSAAPAPVSDTAPSFVHEHHVGAGYPHVYTECARIWNPIHTEERVARAAGLSSILLHGTATWSLAAVAMAQAHAGDEGLRTLRLLEGQFRKPVLPRDTLRIRLLDSQKGSVSFDVHTDRGDTAMSGGYARFGLA